MILENKERLYMALSPLLSLAGILIHPMASTLPPLVLYFLFRNKPGDASKAGLQTADLAFSIQLWLVLISLFLALGISINMVTANEAREMMDMATGIILILFFASLVYAIIQYLSGKPCNHLLSFKIAERVFKLVEKKNS